MSENIEVDNEFISVQKLAAILNMSVRRVQQLAKEGVIPKASHGKYDLIKSVHAYIEFLKIDDDELVDDETQLKGADKFKFRILRAKAEKMEIETAQLKKEVVPVSFVTEVIAKEYAEVRQSLQNVAGSVAPRLLHQDNIAVVTTIINKQIEESLRSLVSNNGIATSQSGGTEATS